MLMTRRCVQPHRGQMQLRMMKAFYETYRQSVILFDWQLFNIYITAIRFAHYANDRKIASLWPAHRRR